MDTAIALFGYRVLDKIRQGNETVKLRPGGPAHFIIIALESLNRATTGLVKGAFAPLEICFEQSDDQAGVTVNYPPDFQRYSSQEVLANLGSCALAIVSPVLDEFPVELFEELRLNRRILVAVDLQGYQRQVSNGRIERRQAPNQIIEQADIIKCTTIELNRQNETLDSITRFSDKIFLVSAGSKGTTVIAGNQRYNYQAEPLAVDAIGAGDTLLGAFCHFYLELGQAAQAGSLAQDYVSTWLKTRSVRQLPELKL